MRGAAFSARAETMGHNSTSHSQRAVLFFFGGGGRGDLSKKTQQNESLNQVPSGKRCNQYTVRDVAKLATMNKKRSTVNLQSASPENLLRTKYKSYNQKWNPRFCCHWNTILMQ